MISLQYCDECIQMTNHKDGECLKCKVPPNSEDNGVQKGAPLATDNKLPPETISKSDGSGTIEIHPEVKKLAIAWIENYTPNDSIMPEIAQKFKLAEDIQRIVDSQREQERQKAIQECIDKANKAEMQGNTIGILVHQLYALKNK